MATEEEKGLTVVDHRAGAVLPTTKAVDEPTPAALLKYALERGAAMEQLDKLLDLQLKWEANEARKSFVAAMAAFRAECPPTIDKDSTVDFKTDKGRTHYRHATLASVMKAVSALMGKHGLSAGWGVVQDQKTREITVTCVVTHIDGHSETVTLTASPDKSGSKNEIQAIGSTITYLERYSILAALGLATEEQDDVDKLQNGNGKTATPHDDENPAPPEARSSTPQKRKLSPRAEKAIAGFSRYVTRHDMEAKLGSIAEDWGGPEFDMLTEIWDQIAGAKLEQRPVVAARLFAPGRVREPGEEG